MEELNFDEAVKKGQSNAISALLLWLCAIVGAYVLKCFMSFVKWVFQK